MVETDILRLKDNLQGLMPIPEVDAVLLFGSHAKGEASERSDTDICIVAPSATAVVQKAKLLGLIWQRINASLFDVWLFEELPLYMQIDIIECHIIIHCRDAPSLYEYFYRFRRCWSSQSLRHEQALETK